MKQVDKESYKFAHYSHSGRWVSYYYQIKEVLRLDPTSVLEIGSGDGVLKNYLRENTKIAYANVDVAEDLHPDAIGSVTALPFADASYDVTCAFEVLEHIPFEDFEQALTEMSRVTRSFVVLSLPHFGPSVKFLLKIPFLSEIKIAFKVPYPRQHIFNGQHYWEIGKRGYSLQSIRTILEKQYEIIEDFIPFENQYHHFFVLKK